MRDVPGLYNNKVIHIECGGVAYYHIGIIKSGDGLNSDKAMYPNGSRPRATDPHICFSCKKSIKRSLTAIRQELRNANPDA